MTDKRVLHRVFTASDSIASKYPTIGKFLSGSSVQNTSLPPATQANTQSQPTQPASDDDLDLLDQLVTQALVSRENQDEEQVVSQVNTNRAKEFAPISAKANELTQSNEANQENNTDQLESAETVSNPEMAELSKEIQEVSKETKEQREQAEIAKKQQEINELAEASNTPVAVSNQPVVVLPITAQSKEEAKFKSTKYSVRWLLEWCKKIAKIFSGAVVYKEEIEDV